MVARRWSRPLPPAKPGSRRDWSRDQDLNTAVTRISEADRLHPGLEPTAAFDLEVRAAFNAYPDGWGMQRVLTCCRILQRGKTAVHLTDEHLRVLWKTRDQP